MTATLANQLFTDAFETEVLEVAEEHPDLRQWSAAGKGKVKARPNGEDATWWRANGPNMVQNWIEWRKSSQWRVWTTPDGQPAIELDINVDVPGLSEPLKAYVDRVFEIPQVAPAGTQPLSIVDLKTGARSPESDFQLGIYRYGIWRKYGVWVDWGAYWMARDGHLGEVFSLTRFTPKLVERIIAGHLKAKEAGIFLPHVTFRCRACGTRDFCAAYGGKQAHLDPDYEKESGS